MCVLCALLEGEGRGGEGRGGEGGTVNPKCAGCNGRRGWITREGGSVSHDNAHHKDHEADAFCLSTGLVIGGLRHGLGKQSKTWYCGGDVLHS